MVDLRVLNAAQHTAALTMDFSPHFNTIYERFTDLMGGAVGLYDALALMGIAIADEIKYEEWGETIDWYSLTLNLAQELKSPQHPYWHTYVNYATSTDITPESVVREARKIVRKVADETEW